MLEYNGAILSMYCYLTVQIKCSGLWRTAAAYYSKSSASHVTRHRNAIGCRVSGWMQKLDGSMIIHGCCPLRKTQECSHKKDWPGNLNSIIILCRWLSVIFEHLLKLCSNFKSHEMRS